MNVGDITLYHGSESAAETYELPDEKLIEGKGQQVYWKHYADPGGQFLTGVWEAEPATWRVNWLR